jgi:N-hydroxyarylamine O-acetyltransferase
MRILACDRRVRDPAVVDLERYLDHIGYDGPLAPSPEALAELQRCHLTTVPFEALDPYLGVEVSVEPADAYRKVVEDCRGGFCFELNGLFSWALEELGYEVRRLAAQAQKGDGQLGPHFSHLTLLVELNRRWLVDVGFGSPFFLEPLDLDERSNQVRGGRPYRIHEEGGRLFAEEVGAEEENGYRFTLEEHVRADFAEQCRIYSTDSNSSFSRRGPVAISFEDDGWLSMTGTRVRGERAGERFERKIESPEQWHRELGANFGLTVEDSRVRGTSAA